VAHEFLKLSNTTTPADVENMSNYELLLMHYLANRVLHNRGLHASTPVTPHRPPYNFDNAEYEQISCSGPKTLYNGTLQDLIPMLNLIHIRHQNEDRYLMTMVQNLI
jgi:hypothetical protein